MTDSRPRAAWWRLALLLIGAQVCTLALLCALVLHQQRNLLLDLTASKIAVLASDIDLAARTGQENGLALEEQKMLEPLLHRLRESMPDIRRAEVFSLGGGKSVVRWALDPNRVGGSIEPRLALLTTRSADLWREVGSDGLIRVGRQLRDERDLVVGGYVVAVDARRFEAESADARAAFLPSALAIAVAALAAIGVALRFLAAGAESYVSSRLSLQHRIVMAAFAVALTSSLALVWQATRISSVALQPALEGKALSIARFLDGKLKRAVNLGIPFDRLGGVSEYFSETLAQHREIIALRLMNGGGEIIAAATQTSPSAQAQGSTLRQNLSAPGAGGAYIEVRTDPEHIARSMRTVLADLGIVLVVALLVFNELLRAFLPRLMASRNAAAGAVNLGAVRLPLFLIILSEELTRSFLPLHIRELAGNATVSMLLGSTTAIGLPMTVYMIFFALATPLGGLFTDRYGARRIFALAALLTLAGFLWAAVTDDFWQFTATRALCATGYALGTMACQRIILAHTDRAARAQGLALLIGAVGIAAICGASIGGVVAERLGAAPVFALCAGVALFALLLFLRLLGRESGPVPTVSDEPSFRFADIGRLLQQLRFAAVMLTAAIPAKIALAGFLFYLVPLALAQEHYSPAAIGRAVMVYFILISFLTPLASRLADRYRLRLAPVVVGSLLIGVGGLAGQASGVIGSDHAVLLGIVALGLGTGLSAASVQALASEVGTANGQVGSVAAIAVFRTIERLGSALGPMLAGTLLAFSTFGEVMAAIGALVAIAALFLPLVPGMRAHD